MSETRLGITPCGVIAAVALPLFLGCVTLYAQESRATVTGSVTDAQGAAIPGTTINARHLATNVETRTTTNQSGLYVLPFLATGEYAVTASVPGARIRES